MAARDDTRRSYGTGSLFEKADSAGRVSYYGKWRHNGVQVKRRIGPKRPPGSRDGLTQRDAEAQLRKMIEAVEVAPAASGEPLTIAELGERYLAHLERAGRKRSTLAAVESVLRVHLQPYFQKRAITAIKYEDVVDLVAMMEAKPIGAKSIHNYIGTLSSLYRFAMHPRRRWATVNPADGVEMPAVPEYTGMRFLEVDQVEALVKAAQPGAYEAIDRALYRVAAMTGLRLGELIALRWRDVDWTASAIRVRSNYVLGQFGTPKSKRSTRSVPLADAAAAALDALHKQAGTPAEKSLVFADPHTAGPLDKARVLRRMRKALQAGGLDETRRFHDLRHTFGTAMAAKGVPMRSLQEWMGHRDISTTERYADYSPKRDEAAIVNDAFAPAAILGAEPVSAQGTI